MCDSSCAENIPDSVIEKITPFIENDAFQPAAIQKVSKACTSICLWVRAMFKYNIVAKTVAPKRERLREAQEELATVQRDLDEKRRRLFEVEQGIAALRAKYEECIAKKEELEHKSQECTARLERANKVRFVHSQTTIDLMLDKSCRLFFYLNAY